MFKKLSFTTVTISSLAIPFIFVISKPSVSATLITLKFNQDDTNKKFLGGAVTDENFKNKSIVTSIWNLLQSKTWRMIVQFDGVRRS